MVGLVAPTRNPQKIVTAYRALLPIGHALSDNLKVSNASHHHTNFGIIVMVWSKYSHDEQFA